MNARQVKEAVTSVRPKWDPTITLGHVIQAAVVVATAIGLYVQVYIGIRDGEAARAKYIPLIEGHERELALIRQRIENFADAFLQLRLQDQDHSKQIGDLKERVAVLESKRGANGLLGPN